MRQSLDGNNKWGGMIWAKRDFGTWREGEKMKSETWQKNWEQFIGLFYCLSIVLLPGD